MKKLFAMMAVLVLAGCSSTQGYYQPQNYQPQPWAKMPFEQAKAECRYATLNHSELWDTYELETPRFKACMEKNGYRFAAGTDWMGNPVPNQPQQ